MDHKRSALTAVVIPLTCVTLVAVGASACGDSDGLNPPLGVPETTESSSYRIGGDELLGDSQSGRTPTVTAPLAPGAPMTGVATTPAVPPPPGGSDDRSSHNPHGADRREADQKSFQSELPIPEEIGIGDGEPGDGDGDGPEEPTSTDIESPTPEVP